MRFRLLRVNLRPWRWSQECPFADGTNERISIEGYHAIIDFYCQLIRNTAI